MLADLERGLTLVRDGHEVVLAWRVLTPDGDFVILTRFNPDTTEVACMLRVWQVI
jgi:hypothetical protein